MTRYTRSIWIPEYGIEVALTRSRGQRWWVVGTSNLPGNARERARARKPRGAITVTAYATSEAPLVLRRKRGKRSAHARH
jgi:hypothetical protein